MPERMMGGGYGGPPRRTGPEESTGNEDKTALLPKSIFPGEVKPGDTVMMKVQAIYSDEVECSVEEEEETETEESPMTADEEIEAAGEEMD